MQMVSQKKAIFKNNASQKKEDSKTPEKNSIFSLSPFKQQQK